MGEVTGRLAAFGGLWRLTAWACGAWEFRRRIDAIAFAKRKGIRLEAE